MKPLDREMYISFIVYGEYSHYATQEYNGTRVVGLGHGHWLRVMYAEFAVHL